MSISDLYAEQNRAYQQKEKYEVKRKDVKEKIRRLKSAQSQVSSIKSQIAGKRSDAALLFMVDKWKGNKFNEHLEEIRDNLMNGYNIYYDETDDILDQIRAKIAKLENESREIQGIIGDIMNWINDIATAIINFID
jgi:chromosome segregation ATPase